jgi:hypothetical protein
LPADHNYKTFRALCGYDSSCDNDNKSTSGTTMEFLFYVIKNQAFEFDLTQLGYGATESVPVYDIWAKESLGTVTGTINTSVPSHGVRLLRLGQKATTGIEAVEKDELQTSKSKTHSTDIYDLQGRHVSSRSTLQAAGHLSSGVYIIDSKKVMVK